MEAGNAIERAYKNICEMSNYMLGEVYFPYVLFLEGSNFLLHNISVTRPDGRIVNLQYDLGSLNRLDRLTASNYGQPINTNLCQNKFVMLRDRQTMTMLQSASIYVQPDGRHWDAGHMLSVMREVARTSLQILQKDLARQLSVSLSSEGF